MGLRRRWSDFRSFQGEPASFLCGFAIHEHGVCLHGSPRFLPGQSCGWLAVRMSDTAVAASSQAFGVLCPNVDGIVFKVPPTKRYSYRDMLVY